MYKTALDYVDQILFTIDESQSDKLSGLKCTGEGIVFLANLIKAEEEKIEQTIFSKASFYQKSAFNIFLPNVFNWFSISTVNYCRTVKLLDLLEKNSWSTEEIKVNGEKIKKACDKYVQNVIPEVYFWRNKVAAHYAATDPKKNDNAAMLEYSMKTPVSWFRDHFYVGVLNLIKGQEVSNASEWSLIEVFEKKLIPRYWPEKRK